MINKNPKIIIISGKARHGKDTLAGMIKDILEKENKKVLITALAKYLKYFAREMTGWDGSDDAKPRTLLQELGTNVIRQELNKKYFFINRTIEDIEIFSYYYDYIIIDDARFKIEIDTIKEKCNNVTSINIVRPEFDNGLTEEQKNHPSEIDLDDYNNFDIVITNNSTIDNLKLKAEKILSSM